SNVIFHCSRPDAFQRIHKFGFGSLCARRKAKLCVEIVRSDECHIYTRQRENVIEILHRLCTLNLNGHDNFIVRHTRILWPIGNTKSIRPKSPTDTTSATGRIFCVLYYPLCFFSRIDHWHDDSPGTSIQCPLEPLDAVRGHTHERSTGPCIGNSAHHASHKHRIMRAMFHIHDEPTKAEPR